MAREPKREPKLEPMREPMREAKLEPKRELKREPKGSAAWRDAEEWLRRGGISRWETMVPLSEYTTWKIGGPARIMAWPEKEEDFSGLARFCADNDYPVRILGLGSNILAADEGVDAIVIHTGRLNRIEWETKASANADTGVSAGAGTPLGALVEESIQRGAEGLEFAAGIPGSLGGAVIMNAGAFGGQMSDILHSVTVMGFDGIPRTLKKDEIRFGYRESGLKEKVFAVMSARMRLRPGDKESVRSKARDYISRRAGTQPLEYPSGGSVFKNPEGQGAGRYIDQAGLKGVRAGKAQISEKHANFIINLGGAKAADVLTLMELMARETKERFGVSLESEVVYWD